MAQVFRIRKLKVSWDTQHSAAHTNRTKIPRNADNERLHLNQQLLGRSDYIPEYIEGVISTCKRKIRPDAVRCVEVVLSADPEYFRPGNAAKAGTWNEQRLQDWVTANVRFMEEQFGDRCVSAVLHLDESTPHIHVHVVPLNEKGDLSCKAFFGGPKQLSKWQDTYQQYVGKLGIKRGIKGSVAEYTTAAQFYELANQAQSETQQQVEQLEENFTLPEPEPEESAADYHRRISEILRRKQQAVEAAIAPVVAKSAIADLAIQQKNATTIMLHALVEESDDQAEQLGQAAIDLARLTDQSRQMTAQQISADSRFALIQAEYRRLEESVFEQVPAAVEAPRLKIDAAIAVSSEERAALVITASPEVIRLEAAGNREAARAYMAEVQQLAADQHRALEQASRLKGR